MDILLVSAFLWPGRDKMFMTEIYISIRDSVSTITVRNDRLPNLLFPRVVHKKKCRIHYREYYYPRFNAISSRFRRTNGSKKIGRQVSQTCTQEVPPLQIYLFRKQPFDQCLAARTQRRRSLFVQKWSFIGEKIFLTRTPTLAV